MSERESGVPTGSLSHRRRWDRALSLLGTKRQQARARRLVDYVTKGNVPMPTLTYRATGDLVLAWGDRIEVWISNAGAAAWMRREADSWVRGGNDKEARVVLAQKYGVKR